ncbi:cellulose biosynthesis cyclic di-GMP-binding regulatory protein BcsB [Pseudomonas ogarae]|uniref:cellulose biosynthesis cyclic di-GMP-binding regulatory protein BcsB n=1 Tax=Pseudomonas ogarae (strain DSM 112162 / CECT 30235 / F113) TaxID=1114970 RepID=UPI0016457F8B|nr:cellulose biosynthesis cyclic di-GMP-binding regulatory protein BcsB [Pseudomonas zarinae]QXH95717.1 cellulose biosynthesis cyclic di-GMP-binding regulatory protein BcsB [Pseudomonas zarinae]
MSCYFSKTLVASLALLATVCAQAATALAPAAPAAVSNVPSWNTAYSFEQLGRPADSLLLGIHNSDQIEFSLRRDRIASDAKLQLEYTPSPSLQPQISHLRVYLNDVLMSVVPIEKDQLGKRVNQSVALDPRLISDFNRVRLEFVGHYTDVCEDPANSTLWLNVARSSQIQLQEQALTLKNDLAYFPMPFFDTRGQDKPVLNVVLADAPTLGEQRAAGILVSYFGSLAAWRGAQFPVLFDQLPPADEHHRAKSAIVFATNDHRPSFLADTDKFPAVDAPVVQMIDNPQDPYSKVLLVLGRNEDDLTVAARALALGAGAFRGSSVTVNKVEQLKPRVPYDAPNWMRTDRSVRFAELIKYPEQLQANGLQPRPITVDVNLPPDLFVWRNQGIGLQTKFRYTPPSVNDDSRLTISLNNQFITSLALQSKTDSRLEELRLAVLSNDSANHSDKLLVPALKIGDRNTLRFDFNFASTFGSAQRDRCQTSLPVNNQAVIDEESTIDLSGYYHYIAMPDLRALARSGFPYSRMADLSQTLVMVPTHSSAVQLSTLFETIAGISARSGLPAFGLRLSDNWDDAKADVDLLVFGAMAPGVGDGADANLVLNKTRAWLLKPSHEQSGKSTRAGQFSDERDLGANRIEVSAQAPIAAIVGLQSPHHPQRSIVALLASDDADYQLLRDTLGDVGKMDAVAGSVALIRSSGVDSSWVGQQYFVGHLPWWLLLWYQLSEHPILLAVMATISVLLTAFLLWRALRWAARRRLAGQE